MVPLAKVVQAEPPEVELRRALCDIKEGESPNILMEKLIAAQKNYRDQVELLGQPPKVPESNYVDAFLERLLDDQVCYKVRDVIVREGKQNCLHFCRHALGEGIKSQTGLPAYKEATYHHRYPSTKSRAVKQGTSTGASQQVTLVNQVSGNPTRCNVLVQKDEAYITLLAHEQVKAKLRL